MSGEAKYTQDAKTHQEIKAYSSAVDDICGQLGKKPIETTKEDLVEFGVLGSMMPKALKALANKYAQFYGVKAWELYHDPAKAKKRCQISDDHLEFLMKYRGIGGAMSYFHKIQVDKDKTFEAPTETVIPKLTREGQALKDQMIEGYKEADRLAAEREKDE